MQQLKAIATIIRLPNVIFIGLAQWLIYLKIIAPHSYLPSSQYAMLALSTACIAAAGYIINDYFDVKIDEINKPQRVTIELTFKRRWVMICHIFLSILGLILAWPITKTSGFLSKYWVQILSICLLIIYSARLKRKAFIGNISIALLTALSIYSVGHYEKLSMTLHAQSQFYFYIVFAFLITWVREIIKDLEDLKGDEADGCTTMPIIMGINFSKKFVTMLITLCLVISVYFLFSTSHLNLAYKISFTSLVLLPLIYSAHKMFTAIKHVHYKLQSRIIKIITFIGIILLIWI
jgi:4-hydroxybenzoate polyprenyltransferase